MVEKLRRSDLFRHFNFFNFIPNNFQQILIRNRTKSIRCGDKRGSYSWLVEILIYSYRKSLCKRA